MSCKCGDSDRNRLDFLNKIAENSDRLGVNTDERRFIIIALHYRGERPKTIRQAIDLAILEMGQKIE